MWNFQFMDNLGGKEWPGLAGCCELITLGFVSFVCDECEWIHTKQFIKPAQAGGQENEKVKFVWTVNSRAHVCSKWFRFQELSAQENKLNYCLWPDHMMKVWTIQTNILIKSLKERSLSIAKMKCAESCFIPPI